MMKTSALWFLLLAGLVAVTNNSLCNPIGPSQMQAGQVTFTASSGVPQNIISVPLPFALSSQTIQSSTSIASFGTHSLVNGIDFLLNSRVRDNSNTLDVILLLRYIGWTNIVASYFATTLSTVFTGGFMVNIADTYDCTTPKTTVYYGYMIPNWKSIPASSIQLIAIYISGFRGVATSTNIFETIMLEQTTGVLGVTITFTSTINCELIKLDYLIITNTLYSFAAPLGVFYSADINMVETSSIVNQAPKLRTIQIFNNRYYCQGSRCPSIYVTSQICTTSNGNIVTKYCIICEIDQVWSNSACACPPNSYLFNAKCTPCPSGLIPSADLQSCVTRP